MRHALAGLFIAAFLAISTPPAGAAGYAVQLASFRSLEDAQAHFRGLKARHKALLASYRALIEKTDRGTRGTYYRLRIGPVGSRLKAAQLCNALIAGGERDCVVRRN